MSDSETPWIAHARSPCAPLNACSFNPSLKLASLKIFGCERISELPLTANENCAVQSGTVHDCQEFMM